MLIAHAPVRVSFFGGGTDLPSYYLQHGGCVLSTTINKYVYVVVSVSERHGLQITSSDYRTFYRHAAGEPLGWDGDLSLARAVLHHFGVDSGLALFLASEVPPGTGLGSSSSVTVGLIKAISTADGQRLSPGELAALACEIEIGKLCKPIGLQDQYAAAFGGINWMTFTEQGVIVEPLTVAPGILARLEANLLLGFIGSSHDSAVILEEQSRSSGAGDAAVIAALDGVKALAGEGRAALLAGDLDRFGRLLDEAWQHKRRFAPGVSNERIERLYRVARDHGALGGKIAGAGGGGFLMICCEDGAAPRVGAALEAQGVRCMEYCFEADGARVLFNAGLRLPGSTGQQRLSGEPGGGKHAPGNGHTSGIAPDPKRKGRLPRRGAHPGS